MLCERWRNKQATTTITRYRIQHPVNVTIETCRKGSEPLRWRHNDHDSVSNHQPHGCLLNRLFRRRSKKTSKLRVTGLCVGNSPEPVNSPHKGPVTRKMFPFDDVIMPYIYSTGIENRSLRRFHQHWLFTYMTIATFLQLSTVSYRWVCARKGNSSALTMELRLSYINPSI